MTSTTTMYFFEFVAGHSRRFGSYQQDGDNVDFSKCTTTSLGQTGCH